MCFLAFPCIICLLDKALKETLDQILLSGYFDQTPPHLNGACEEEEAEEPASAVALTESSEAGDQAADPGSDHSVNLCCMKLYF